MRLARLPIVVLPVLLTLAGCGASASQPKVASSATTAATEPTAASAPKASATPGSAKGTIAASSNGDSVSVTEGTLPADFPKDIPVPNGKITGSITTTKSGKPNWLVTVGVADADKSVNDMKAKMKSAGFEIKDESKLSAGQGSVNQFGAVKGSLTVSVIGTTDASGSNSPTILISAGPTEASSSGDSNEPSSDSSNPAPSADASSTTSSGSNSKTSSVASSTADGTLPADFPKEIPLPAGKVGQAFTSTADGKQTWIVILLVSDIDKSVDEMSAKLKSDGYKVDGELKTADGKNSLRTFTAVKSPVTVVVQGVMGSDSPDGPTILITASRTAS